MTSAILILHLEDDAADARLILDHLQRAGLEVAITLVADGEAFESALAGAAFDVVLSDYHLPRFNGLEALNVARGRCSRTPFIFVTGALGDERAVELLRSGATDFVLKDRLARLAPAIRRALTEAQERTLREHTEARLADALRMSKVAAEAARLGTWHLDVSTGRLECSDEFLGLIGVERATWGGTIAALETVVHPDDVERHRSAQAGAIAQSRFMELEFRIRRPDGEVRWMHSRGDCLRRAGSDAASVLGVTMDITDRKRIEEALCEADRRKDEFLAMLAHELRNPLAPICNGLLLLRPYTGQVADAERIHEMLERQVKHIVRLVDDLLDVSRMTLGKIELKREPVELGTVIRSALEMSRPLIEAASHQLDLYLPPEPLTLYGDPVRLTQVLSNLLNNAANYTESGGNIRLSAEQQGDRAMVRVRDTGVGIPVAMLQRVFDLFTQLERSDGVHAHSGLGIGLTMVRLLVEMHGGEVEAFSDGTGKGSEFVVHLPLATDGHALAARPTDFPDVQPSSTPILVVDDNRDAADSLCMLLNLMGAEARVAYDGASALETLSVYHPTVVFLDLSMPGMDGYELAQRIRAHPLFQDITMIALSGWGQVEDRLRSHAAGFRHHLTKPVDFDVLQALLRSLEYAHEGSPTTRNG